MIITGFIQVRNELQTGHLERFFKWNSELFDHIACFDDASSDGSYEFLQEMNVGLLVRSPYCSFGSELSNKRKLLIEARKKFPDTDWFLWLDADEVLFTSREELEDLLNRAVQGNYSGVSFPLTNLWKDEGYFRTDSGYDSLSNVRLWRNSAELEFASETGLHKLLHPKGIGKILEQQDIHVTHFGFATESLIARKFSYYRNFGQQGSNLWRLIDESAMNLSAISLRSPKLGARFSDYNAAQNRDKPVPLKTSIFEYLSLANEFRDDGSTRYPFVTLVCLIYSGVDWLEFQYGELLALQKELAPGEVEILFVANDANQEVLNFLIENNIPYVVAPGRKSPDEWYIDSVYRAYNFGAKQAQGKFLLFVNSDMAYAPGFLHAMVEAATAGTYVTAKLVESGRLTPAKIAIKKNFGKSLKSFKRKSFYRYAQKLQAPTQQDGGLYMPAIVSKDDFLSCEGFPEGNIKSESVADYIAGAAYLTAKVGDDLISGDDAFIRRFLFQDGKHITINSAIVYHFQEGEKSSASLSANKKVGSGIAILNDQLIGINGELTLWNYLIEDLSADNVRVIPVSLGVNQRIPYRLSHQILWRNPRPRLVFRNATFLRKIAGPWRQIALIQDNIHDPKLLRSQSSALRRAETRVTNSFQMMNFPKSSQIQNRYLLPVPIHPDWQSTQRNSTREKDFDAIFVGSFNDTKGWGDVKEIVYQFPHIKFLLVSKYLDDNPGFRGEIQPPNVTIQRCLDTAAMIRAVDRSRIYIVGSPFETQCLAAIEAASRDLVVCMKETGLLFHLPVQIKNKVGVFNNNLVVAFQEIMEIESNDRNRFSPASALLEAHLDSRSLREEWKDMLLSELKYTFYIKIKPTFFQRLKKIVPVAIKMYLKKSLRS
jgi:glycosyltransferase involved in cell wall biosynthesis